MSKDSFDWGAFGQEIARLRNRKYWSRADLLNALENIQGYNRHLTNEKSAKRLEEGDTVNVPPNLVICLIKVLECNTEETAKLLLLANQNILTDKEWLKHPFVEEYNLIMFTVSIKMKILVETSKSNKEIRNTKDKYITLYRSLAAIIDEEIRNLQDSE